MFTAQPNTVILLLQLLSCYAACWLFFSLEKLYWTDPGMLDSYTDLAGRTRVLHPSAWPRAQRFFICLKHWALRFPGAQLERNCSELWHLANASLKFQTFLPTCRLLAQKPGPHRTKQVPPPLPSQSALYGGFSSSQELRVGGHLYESNFFIQ